MPPWTSPNRAVTTYSDISPSDPKYGQQRGRLQGRADQQGGNRADTIGNPAEAEPADDARREHQRQHLRTADAPVTEIHAISDYMDLRHCHRDAAGHSRKHQQQLQPVWARRRHFTGDGPGQPGRCLARCGGRRRSAHNSGSIDARQNSAMPI